MNKILEPAFEKNNVPVCFFSDNYYVPYLGTAVLSVILNAEESTNLDIIIFENEYSEENKSQILSLKNNKNNVSIRFLELQQFINRINVNPNKRVSVNCFAKIFCTDIMFKNYKRIIVADADLLVLCDLKELYDTDMEGMAIAAVRDLYVDIMTKRGYHTDARLGGCLLKEYFETMNLDADNYFNSGVLVFDIGLCQKNNMQEKIIEINQNYPTMMYAAQDDLNIVFKNQWKHLDAKWNIQNPYALLAYKDDFPRDYADVMNSSGILHYLGKSKPWNDKYIWKRDEFDKYAVMTPWSEVIRKRQREAFRKKWIAQILIPKGSRRRQLVLKLYYGLKAKKITG